MLQLPSYSLSSGFLGRVTAGRMGVQQWVLHLRSPAKKARTKHAGNAAAAPSHKTHWTFNLPSLNLPRFSSSPASHLGAGRIQSMQNEAFLLLKVEHCCSNHMAALTRKATPPPGQGKHTKACCCFCCCFLFCFVFLKKCSTSLS